MRVAVKPVITTSVALVGASVIAVTPIQAPAPTVRVIESDVSLSASSVAYVPVNMIQQALSAPANMVAALDRLAAAMVISGSWNENHANNQWGWDEANPAMLKELVNTLMPFPALSEPLGRHLNWWATANLPMYEGCNYDCPDLPGMLDRMFKVPMSEFYDEDGYTFPEVRTPFNGEETPWSNETVKLDPAEPLRSLWDSLTAEPTGIQTTTWWEVVTAVANFSAAMQVTGHMPDWVAVREIEQFFKHFLRPPVEQEADNVETPAEATQFALVSDAVAPVDEALAGLSPTPALRTSSTGAADVSDTVDAAGADTDSETSGAGDAPATSEAASVVDTATNFLKGKFARAQIAEADEADATDESDESEAADEAAAGEDDDSADDTKTAGSGGSGGSLGSDSSVGSDSSASSDTGSDSGSDSSDSGSSGSGGSGGSGSGGDS